MKLKRIIPTLGLALAMGFGIAGGLNSNNGYKPVKADTTLQDGYYLCGEFIGWVHANSKKMTLESENVYVYDGLYLTGAGSDHTFQIYKVESGTEYWDYPCTADPTCDAGIANYIWNSGNNAGIKFNEGIRTVKISVNISTKAYTIEWSKPYLQIGNTTERMASYKEDADEYYHTIEDAAANSIITIKTADGTVLDNYNDDDGHNFYVSGGNKKLITGGDITVYYKRTTTLTWVGGYTTSLHNFVTGFLADTISAGTCANPVTTEKSPSNVWQYYYLWHEGMDAAEKASFQEAVTAINGDPSSWSTGNELSEAAARYVHLMQKYGNLPENPTYAFSGVVIASAKYVPVASNLDAGNSTLLVAVTSVFLLVAVSGFFILRRKEK